MSKIIFISLPAYGHVNPTLPVVAELIQRGHEVIYYNTEEFRPTIERTHVSFRHYPEPNLVSADFATLAQNLIHVTRFILSESKRLLPFFLKELEREQPDVVVFDSITLWGMQAAHLLQLSSVSSISTFVQEDVKGLLTWRDGLHLLRQGLPIMPDIIKLRRDLVNTYGPNVFPHKDIFPVIGDENIVYTSRAFQPATPFINDSFHFVGPSINLATRADDDFPWEQLNGRPLIYISLGTLYHTDTSFYQLAFDAFRDHPGQFVLSAGTMTDIASLGRIPDNFIVRNSVPQLRLLQQVDLFVTHGGMNSVNEALYYGVPQVVVPQQIEQLLNARQVATQGAGLILGDKPPYGRTTSQELRHAVDQLLFNDSYRQNAQRLSHSFQATGGFVEAADIILNVATRQHKATKETAVMPQDKHPFLAHS